MVRCEPRTDNEHCKRVKVSRCPVAAPDRLPPPGPYLTGRDAHAAVIALKAASETITTALTLIRERAGATLQAEEEEEATADLVE
jgi:hypothetical protein